MVYYRLIFRKEDGETQFTEIYEQSIDNITFNSMNWEKPIIRHYDGKYLHFISIEKSYLEAVLLGFQVCKEF